MEAVRAREIDRSAAAGPEQPHDQLAKWHARVPIPLEPAARKVHAQIVYGLALRPLEARRGSSRRLSGANTTDRRPGRARSQIAAPVTTTIPGCAAERVDAINRSSGLVTSGVPAGGRLVATKARSLAHSLLGRNSLPAARLAEDVKGIAVLDGNASLPGQKLAASDNALRDEPRLAPGVRGLFPKIA